MSLYEEMVANGHVNPVQQNNPSQGSKPSLYDEMVQNQYATPTQEQPTPEVFRASVPSYASSEDRLRAAGVDPSKANQIQQGEPGFFQSVVQGIAKPFLNVGSSAYSVVDATNKLFQGDNQGAQESLDKPRDFGYFGKDIKPMGSVTPEQAFTPEGAGRMGRDAASNALQLAPYFLGGGFKPSGIGLGSKVAAGTKTGATIGGMSSLGSALGDDASASETVARTGAGVLGGAAAGATMPLLQAGARRLFGASSGLGSKTLEKFTSKPDSVNYGRDMIASGGDESGYYQLGQQLKEKLVNDKSIADQTWIQSAKAFQKTNPSVRLNVAEQLGDIATPLQEFGLNVVKDKGKFVVIPDGPTGFSPKQLGEVSNLLNKFSSYTALRPEQLPRLLQEISAAYEAVPIGNNGPLPYHALIMQMKAPVSNTLKTVMPKELLDSYAMQEAYYDAMEKYGSKVVNKAGESTMNASNFLRSIANPGRGELRDKVGEGLVNRVQSIKDAEAISHIFPPTGSRNEDVFRQLVAYFGAIPTGGASVAIASPAVVGNAALGIGKLGQAGVTGALKTGILEGVSEPTGKALLTQARKRILGQ